LTALTKAVDMNKDMETKLYLKNERMLKQVEKLSRRTHCSKCDAKLLDVL
jgi:hypothetical protein